MLLDVKLQEPTMNVWGPNQQVLCSMHSNANHLYSSMKQEKDEVYILIMLHQKPRFQLYLLIAIFLWEKKNERKIRRASDIILRGFTKSLKTYAKVNNESK